MEGTAIGSEAGRAFAPVWARWLLVLFFLFMAGLGGLSYLAVPDTWHAPADPSPAFGSLLSHRVGSEQSSSRPYLGITYQEMTGGTGAHPDRSAVVGVLVASVVPGSPAAMGGLRTGDVLLAVNGEPLGPDITVLKLLRRQQPGDRMKLIVQRGQEHLNLEVLVGRQ